MSGGSESAAPKPVGARRNLMTSYGSAGRANSRSSRRNLRTSAQYRWGLRGNFLRFQGRGARFPGGRPRGRGFTRRTPASAAGFLPGAVRRAGWKVGADGIVQSQRPASGDPMRNILRGASTGRNRV